MATQSCGVMIIMHEPLTKDALRAALLKVLTELRSRSTAMSAARSKS
jgi:hypothetical protein